MDPFDLFDLDIGMSSQSALLGNDVFLNSVGNVLDDNLLNPSVNASENLMQENMPICQPSTSNDYLTPINISENNNQFNKEETGSNECNINELNTMDLFDPFDLELDMSSQSGLFWNDAFLDPVENILDDNLLNPSVNASENLMQGNMPKCQPSTSNAYLKPVNTSDNNNQSNKEETGSNACNIKNNESDKIKIRGSMLKVNININIKKIY